MSHTYEKLSSNKVKFTFAIPAEQFDAAMQKAYLKNRGKINIPGFRRGKAPRVLIERMYGEAVFYDDAFEILFPDAYDEAVKAEDVTPVDRPQVDVQQIGAGQELQFTCEVFVRPDVTLGEYQNLNVTYTEQTVTEEQVDSRIQQDQERASRMVDVEDRPVEKDDIVNLDYAGTVDGVAFEGGAAQGQTLTIGSNQFIPGFEEQMIGMALGEEKDLNVTFPQEYHAKELAGKEAVFHVKVNGIQKKELPELDDDFAMDISDFDTFQAYKDDVRQKLQESAEKNNETAIENALVEKAVENAQVDIPEAMVEDEVSQLLREMQLRMAYQGIRMEDYLKYTGQTPEQMREMYKGEARGRVKTQLVLEAIRKAEGIEPTEEDVEKQIVEQAQRSGKELEAFRQELTENQKEYLKESAGIQKVVDLLKTTATAEPKAPEAEKTEEAKEAE